jgi:23S rRNA pseudouridine1911/1915/1917 synthase
MPARRFKVGLPSAGTRLDIFLAAACSDLTRSRIRRLIEEGAVRIGGAAARPSRPVRAGEEVEVDLPEPRKARLEAEEIPLAIVYEDSELLAIDKPPGIVVHPSPGHGSGTLVNALLHHVRDLAGVGGEMRPGIVHRLDRDTSGVLLVAKTDRAHASLSRQMKKRTMRKEYLALSAGSPRVRKGDVALPIGRDPRDRKKMRAFRGTVEELPAGVREAKTLFELERDFPSLGLSLLRCRLVTGRTHQIRVHLAAAGLPIVGDPVYGRARYDKVRDASLRRRLESFPRQALHAERVAFRHPATNEPLEISAPLPADLRDLLEAIRGQA